MYYHKLNSEIYINHLFLNFGMMSCVIILSYHHCFVLHVVSLKQACTTRCRTRAITTQTYLSRAVRFTCCSYHRCGETSWDRVKVKIVITFYSPSCLDQETAKGFFGLRVKVPPAHLSTTHDGGFTQSLWLLSIKQGSCEYQFLQFLVWHDRESNPGLLLQ